MCESPATSHEHVQPKCIFPERKDSQGDHRTQLITVPACDTHNSRKSKDDEFLMVSLAGIIGNNSIGYRHKFTKVNRAIRNTSGRLLNAAFLKRKHYRVNLENNAFLEVIWGTPDHDRLEACFDRLARGLFRHHFGRNFRGKLKIMPGYLDPANKNSASFMAFIKHRAELELRGKQRCGHNSGVFYYQFTDPDEHGLFMLRMCFYEGADEFVSFLPEGTKPPFLLGRTLIEGGIKTHIELEGKSYEFN
jgi:hypothetical protein